MVSGSEMADFSDFSISKFSYLYLKKWYRRKKKDLAINFFSLDMEPEVSIIKNITAFEAYFSCFLICLYLKSDSLNEKFSSDSGS